MLFIAVKKISTRTIKMWQYYKCVALTKSRRVRFLCGDEQGRKKNEGKKNISSFFFLLLFANEMVLCALTWSNDEFFCYVFFLCTAILFIFTIVTTECSLSNKAKNARGQWEYIFSYYNYYTWVTDWLTSMNSERKLNKYEKAKKKFSRTQHI